MGKSKVKGIVVEIGGDTTSLSKAINNVSADARTTQSELKKIERLLKMDPGNTVLLKQKQDLLNQSIEKTQDVVKALQTAKDKADADMASGTQVNENAYRELERQIQSNEITLRNARKEADKVAQALKDVDDDSIQDVADAADDAKGSLEGAKKEAASFGDVLKAGAIVEAADNIVGAIKDVAEETKEYRKIMGSLDVSSEQAGYTAEQTQEAYKELYGVLADDQSSATTLANLQALGLSQDKLLELIQNTVGGWAKYGDSIPIDGLAEAVNETAKAGKVTGTFADVLNWGTKEGETYGVKLKENISFTKLSAKELKNLSDEELASYEAKKALWEQTEKYNQEVLACASAEDFFNMALQNCSTEAERVDLIMQAMADQSLSSIGEKWKENNATMVESNEVQADMQEQLAVLGEQIEPIVTRLTEMVVQALEWFNSLDSGTQMMILGTIAIVAALGPVMVAFSGVSSCITGVINILPVLQNTFSSVLGFIAANPIVLLIAAIVGLVALIAIKGDEIQAALQKVDDFLQGVFARDWTEVFGPVLGGILNDFFAVVKGIWDSIKLIFDGIIDFIRGVFTGDWERAWNGVVEIFGGIFDGLVWLAKAPINAVIGLINGAIYGINAVIRCVNKLPGVNIGTIGSIPMLAKGGTVWSGSAIVGEAGPELLTVNHGRAVVQPLTNNTTNNATHLGGVNIAVYGAPGQNVRELANIVMDEIQHVYSQKEAAL